MGLTNFSFTPSELILLRADKFAPEAKEKDAHQLLCSDGTVDGAYLATMILAAAILANVEENALKLEIRQQKKKRSVVGACTTVLRSFACRSSPMRFGDSQENKGKCEQNAPPYL